MRGVNPGEVWMIDFGMAAKVRPALLLTGEPAADELDLVTVLLHTTSLRSSRWELNIPKPFLKPGAFHLQQVQTISTVKLERRLGVLTSEEMDRVRNALKTASASERSCPLLSFRIPRSEIFFPPIVSFRHSFQKQQSTTAAVTDGSLYACGDWPLEAWPPLRLCKSDGSKSAKPCWWSAVGSTFPSGVSLSTIFGR